MSPLPRSSRVPAVPRGWAVFRRCGRAVSIAHAGDDGTRHAALVTTGYDAGGPASRGAEGGDHAGRRPVTRAAGRRPLPRLLRLAAPGEPRSLARPLHRVARPGDARRSRRHLALLPPPAARAR